MLAAESTWPEAGWHRSTDAGLFVRLGQGHGGHSLGEGLRRGCGAWTQAWGEGRLDPRVRAGRLGLEGSRQARGPAVTGAEPPTLQPEASPAHVLSLGSLWGGLGMCHVALTSHLTNVLVAWAPLETLVLEAAWALSPSAPPQPSESSGQELVKRVLTTEQRHVCGSLRPKALALHVCLCFLGPDLGSAWPSRGRSQARPRCVLSRLFQEEPLQLSPHSVSASFSSI